jgi:hypothetical protein
VRRIYVLRDTPTATKPEEACMGHALRTHASWSRCTESRAAMLRPDQAAIAAAHSSDPRVKLLDLTRFLCSASVCPPVIGGVLVRKDGDHLTRLFSSTLGRFVLRALG